MRKVDVHILIKTDPAGVIRAFTDPSLLRDWWSVEKSFIELRTGGLYTLAWQVTAQGIGYITTGIIHSYHPEAELVIGNLLYINAEKPFLGPMTLRVKATGTDGGSILYLCQEGYLEGEVWEWYYHSVQEAWPEVLRGLKGYLEARPA
ncbi:MAG: SRPBCC domain-containing protein [Saprospiraceae bacterium]|nr:SRPBCC domain-containing protein [Saprospiraceae bacterium]